MRLLLQNVKGLTFWGHTVVLEKHTIQYNIQYNTIQDTKKHTNKTKAGGKVCRKELKWRTAAMRNSRNNINDTDNTRNLSCVN